MSLQIDIKEAYENNIGTSSDEFSKDLSEAIQNFLKKQRFLVKNLRAYVQIDSIKTDGDIPVDVKETTILGQYAPIIDVLEKLGKGFKSMESIVPAAGPLGDSVLKPIEQMKKIAKTISKEGATQKKLDFDKNGAIGGTMTGIAHAIIGPDAVGLPGADTTEEMGDDAEIYWDGNER